MTHAGDELDGIDEIVQEFLVESYENLDQLDRDLVALEKTPGSRELLSSIFRTIHTIKGTSGFLAFNRLESLTHAGENLLSRLRDGQLTMTGAIADALLRMVDAVRALLKAVERTGGDDDGTDLGELVELLGRLASGTSSAVEPAPAAAGPEAAAPEAGPPADVPTTVPDTEDTTRPAVADSTVRVDVDLLDTLVQLVGELVLVRNQILQQSGSVTTPELARASQRLDLVASELQENVMKTRMQPIGQVWAKLPRVVRDLGVQLGKTVTLVMEGHDTELDRTLLEAVKDPITHLVRNAIDHGLENAGDRLAAGKSPDGTLTLRAYHESGQVIVEISDDGRGIDPAKVARTAVQRGILTQDAVAAMDPRDVLELIFKPGFSTAQQVTNVSGRGVGMDVVRTNIERIGGTVDLSSVLGAGTTFRVRIPLTLAIIPALVVEEAGERFAIPQANLVELVRLEGADPATIEVLAGAPVLRLRGHLLPLVSMAGVLGVEGFPGTSDDPAAGQTVVVVQADDLRFGLTVGQVHDTQEIVVKPLGRQLKAIPLYAGATIMGDGRVALILDIAGVAHSSGVTKTDVVPVAEARGAGGASSTVLVLEVGSDRRAALPLAEVSRLEEIPAAAIERSGAVEVVQYRDGILPLVRLSGCIGVPDRAESPDPLPVVVHGSGAERVGIVVDRVLDVVEAVIEASPVGRRPGVLGSAVLDGRVTDLVDLDTVVASVSPAARSAA